MMTLQTTDARASALHFLMADLEIPIDDRAFFTILAVRNSGSEWYTVDIGVEGLPDKWVLQVFDTGYCDPCYTFVSPLPAGDDSDLQEFPPSIAEVVAAERKGRF